MQPLKIDNPENVVRNLQDEIRRSEESRYDHRLHAILLIAKGLSAREAANRLGDAARTVEFWVHRFQEAGLEGLHEVRRPGRPSRLSPEQIAQVQSVLRSAPADAGLTADAWDSNTLSIHLRSLGVRLQPRQCRNLLRRWQLSER
jgi:transposase